MSGCLHWNITVMVKSKSGDTKLCHVFYDNVYQESYRAEASAADRDVEVWCDDCESFWSHDRDDLPAWIQVAVTEAESAYEEAQGHGADVDEGGEHEQG